MLIGIDDTDSPRGGCTTHVMTEVLRAGQELGLDVIGEPRLVRLNPNVPWKTRGNAALAARFGHGTGAPRIAGALPGGALKVFPKGRPLTSPESRRIGEEAWERVHAGSQGGDEHTDPAMVAVDRPLPAGLYWEAVRSVVPVSRVERMLKGRDAVVRVAGSRRGLIGAAAAVAWRGAHPTWELIAYRSPERIGRPREVDARAVREAARAHAELFLCHDPLTRRLMVAPHSPCPILLGLRSTDPRQLPEILESIPTERVERWVIFRTNQATGDHLSNRSIADLAAYSPGRLTGRIAGPPSAGPGGHVRFVLEDRTGRIECLAFEPTKTLPRVARSLLVGDIVSVWGGRGADRTFRLEGLRLRRLRPRLAPATARTCPRCRSSVRSLGTGRGFRCRSCRFRLPPEGARGPRISPIFGPGTYHPTPSARRHLAPRGPEPVARDSTD